MLQVGLIGLGPEWQYRFRPALERLSKRLQVRSVYATVGCQAEQTAVELNCDVAPGLLALTEREDVRALLVLETDWHADVPAWIACQFGKPVFLAGRLASRFCRADLQRQAADAGVTLMPGLEHRYTPATSRLKELIATRLGRPLMIEIVVGPGPGSPSSCSSSPGSPGDISVAGSHAAARELLATAVDWCINLVGTVPQALVPNSGNGSVGTPAAAQNYDVEFRRPSAGGEAARGKIHVHAEPLSAASNDGSATSTIFQQIRIRCTKGEAVLEPPCGITWEVNGVRVAESLTADRTDVEVMLDHFTRRVLGGLIPVPTLDDVQRAARDLAAVLP